MELMKAVVVDQYGLPEVAKIKEVPVPTIKSSEILIKIKAAAVTVGDARIRGAKFPKGFKFPAKLALGIFKPRNKILGISFSGEVVSTGDEVSLFKTGDEVMGMSGFKMGAHTEYLKMDEKKGVIKKPKNISHIDAAGVSFGGTTAVYFLKNKAKISEGTKILINGASGAVGTNAVQISKYFNAEVTAVCGTQNVELIKSLGADKIIDYKTQPLFKDEDKYDIILDLVGNLSFEKVKNNLTSEGKVILAVASLGQMIKPNKKVIVGTSSESKEDLEFLIEMMELGKLKVITDKVYDFENIVEAYTRVDSGHKIGNVVLVL